MNKPIFISIIILLSFFSCSNPKSPVDSNMVSDKNTLTNFYRFNSVELSKFGIFIVDSNVMYNNKIYNLGTLNLLISGEKYSAGTATSVQTNFDFYPRYITTMDTVQRYAYNLQGKGSNTIEEAQKWATFDKLIPIVVEQKLNGQEFGETLIFWFTKTDSLLVKLDKK
ncbi:MAG: hypothetical protein AB9846_10175 [Tenuifilaceae bacterium]